MTAQKLDPSFKIIDDALANYYIGVGYSNYRDSGGVGLFLKYIIDEELNDPDSPIDRELGDDCDPNDCAYSWMNNYTEFPIPSYAEIPGQQKEAFIYYILQYCYKFKQAPSNQYIQSILISKCGATIKNTFPTSINNNDTTTRTQITNQNDDDRIESPAAKNTNKCIMNDGYNDKKEPLIQQEHIKEVIDDDDDLEDRSLENGDDDDEKEEFISLERADGSDNTLDNGDDDEKEQLVSLERGDIDKKLNALKQQIRAQQESITRLKESLLRANKYITNDGNNNTLENGNNDEKEPLIQQEHIQDVIDDDNDDLEDRSLRHTGDESLDQIVDGVIKKYDVLDFRMIPTGAKRNIYIDKQFTKSWMNHVIPRFNDEAMMYYWLDYTTAIQMIQKYAKQYVNKENKEFIVAVINYELTDNANNILYGIILCDDQKNDKYPYKLKAFMTKQQIYDTYGIYTHDLPKKSRRTQAFINKLLLQKSSAIQKQITYIFVCGYCREYFDDEYESIVQLISFHVKLHLERDIIAEDLERGISDWSDVKLVGFKSVNDAINVKAAMKNYCSIKLMRLNHLTDISNHLIPIAVSNDYEIEWVLMIRVVHRDGDAGIAFRYDEKTKVFVATAIYLDKREIENKHESLRLQFDYCINTESFNFRKFRFIDQNWDSDEDEEEEDDTKISSSLELQSNYEDDDIYDGELQNSNQMQLAATTTNDQHQQNMDHTDMNPEDIII